MQYQITPIPTAPTHKPKAERVVQYIADQLRTQSTKDWTLLRNMTSLNFTRFVQQVIDHV